MRICASLTIIFCIFTSHVIFAGGATLREQCRSELSGQFLSAINDRKQFEEIIETLKNSQSNLKNSIKKYTKRREELTNSKKDKDLYYQRHLDEIDANLSALNNQASENEKLILQSSKELDGYRANENMLQTKLTKVFNVIKVNELEAGEITWKIDYKQHCPKYRESCPLPESQRLILRDVLREKTPDACVKYAQQR